MTVSNRIFKGWLIISALLFSVLSLRAEESTNSVLNRLSKVQEFAFGGIGYAGATSDGEKDYCEILQRSSALKDFEQLLKTGNPQAQCYALTGIHALNPKGFGKISAPYLKNQTSVSTMEGCCIGKEPMATIVKRIKDGFYKPHSKRL